MLYYLIKALSASHATPADGADSLFFKIQVKQKAGIEPPSGRLGRTAKRGYTKKHRSMIREENAADRTRYYGGDAKARKKKVIDPGKCIMAWGVESIISCGWV